ncbi:hypothetical protein [Lacinutrix salivirga]
MKKIAYVLSFVLLSSCGNKIYKSNKEERILKTGTIMEMNSEEFLIQNNTWNLKSSDNFKFYFDKSIDSKLTEEISDTQEENFTHIVRLMGIEKKEYPKVIYFLFKDKNQKIALTQVNSDAHVIAPNVYYLPKNAKGGQEVGHVITQTVWGFIPNDSEYALLIDEGFNYYIDNDKFYSGKLDEYALEYINANQAFEITDLTKNGNGKRNNGGHSLNESYVAGSFVKYLIEKYGTEKFGDIWKSAVTHSEPDFEKNYGKGLAQIGNEYKINLK